MVQGPPSRKIRYSIDEKSGRDDLTTLDGIQNSVFGSVNDRKEIVEEFERPETDSKRIKLIGSYQEVLAQNVSEQSSPLGLTLKKSPSFLDLIEMKLSQGRKLSRKEVDSEKDKAGSEELSAQPNPEKMKASNFPANLLRIGTWERVSMYEGDLVAKCYYAKRKLVWEVLERGLKSKIEIQWAEISAIRAIFRKNEADILEIELSRAPMFFRETNPQPRKHTLWQTTSDFTGGQAPIYRRHFVQFPEGTLERHYENLLQCDNRLLMLSKLPFPTINSPYFHSNLYRNSDFSFGFNEHLLGSPFPLSIHRPNAMPLHQLQHFQTVRPSFAVNDSTSPMSVMEFSHIRGNGSHYYSRQQHQRGPFWVHQGIRNDQNQGIRNDQNLYSRKGEVVGEVPLILSTPQDSPLSSQQQMYHHQVLDKIADHLLNDPFASVCSDEQRVLAKVKSMYNLLDMPKEAIPTSGNIDTNSTDHFNIGMKPKAYEGEDYKMNNHTLLRNMEQSTGGNGSLCPEQLVNRLPIQGSYVENPLMNLTRPPSFPYFLDPAMEDSICAAPPNEGKQW